MTIQNASLDSNAAVRITAIYIDCCAAQGYVRSTLVQAPEVVTVNERKRLPTGETVDVQSFITVHSRSFPAYVPQPAVTARRMASEARRMFPGVPVTLYNA